MQDIIINEYLKNALVTGPRVEALVKTLFQQCYELPDDIAKERPSYLNFSKTMQWKGDIINGYIAALATLNSQHGCFTDCYEFIENTLKVIPTGKVSSFNTKVIPGFGNPIRDGQDHRCREIEVAFNRLPTKLTTVIKNLRDSVVNRLAMKGDIRENLVFWNAAIAYSLGLSKHYAPIIFIISTQLRYLDTLNTK